MKRTVGDSNRRFDNLSGSHLQSQSDFVSSVDGIYVLVIDLISQLNCHVIGYEDSVYSFVYRKLI